MSLTQALHRNLQQGRHATALIDGDVERTWEELVDDAARTASGLIAHGAWPGDRVGILSENSRWVVTHAFACAWAGAVITPINYRLSVGEMSAIVEEAGIEILFVGEGYEERAQALRQECPSLQVLLYAADGDAPDGFESIGEWLGSHSPIDDARMDSRALSMLLYTGGTTGEPKGVMLSAANVLVSGLGTAAASGSHSTTERFLVVAPMFHLAALGGMLNQVAMGSAIVIARRFDPSGLVDLIQRHRIDGVTLVPTMIRMLLSHLERTGDSLPSLTAIGYGAESITPTLLAQLLKHLPGGELLQRYGMTELGPVATVLPPSDHTDPDRPHLLASVGRAAVHAELRIVGPDDEPLPVGEVGEIVVRGDNVMLGYWERPEETAVALRGGWMHTGDAGRLDEEGYLFLADRLKDMIISGGENIYSAEVEKAVAAHPSVSQVAVIGVPDDRFGETVRAVVILREGASLELEELREFLAPALARYKLPRELEVVEEFPLSPVGKVLKRELRNQRSGS